MKQFLKKISYTLLPIWLILVLGTAYVALFIYPEICGDISHVGLLPFGHDYENLIGKEWPKEMKFATVEDIEELQQVHADVLTIGDSFSQRDEDAYQNYLCYKGLSVVNCERHMFYNPMTFAYEVMNLDIIDSTRVKVLVVEIVERYVENFMTHFEPNPQKSTLMTKRKKLKDKRPTRWSLERARSFLFLRTGYVENPVILEQLDADYFSSDKPQALYYYNEDLDGLSISKEKEGSILANYQRLLDLAQEKHIKLIFLVAADKYDMYQGHIINNPNGMKTVNEDIARILKNDPHLLVSKDYLQPMIDQGEKDVYLYNDSHWSYKAAKVIADELSRRIFTEK
jgi:hypothetical protein